MATTTYRLDSPKQDASLTSPKLNAPLKPNYSYINNGDDSEANRNLSQLCNTNLYIDLEHLLEIWHPHDAWFATKISGGILGKLIWNLSQCLTKGTIEELCQLLEPTGNYVYKKLIPKMMQANLLEMKENKLKWIGDGQILESIAQAGDVQGKQNKRIKNIKKRQEDRAKAFEEYEKWRQEQLKQATKDTLETKFGTLEAQKLDLRRIQNFDNLEGF
jgi:hypothetical protein